MPSIRVAHLKRGGQDMVIIPCEPSFGYLKTEKQQEYLADMQRRTELAGLSGKVVAVWDEGFIAPEPWHPLFKMLKLETVRDKINKEIFW